MITVKELKAVLEDLPEDTLVVIQKDAEGSDYSPCAAADGDAVYVAQTTWRGIVYSLDYSAKDACMSEEKWSEVKALPRCLVLAPIC